MAGAELHAVPVCAEGVRRHRIGNPSPDRLRQQACVDFWQRRITIAQVDAKQSVPTNIPVLKLNFHFWLIFF